MHEYENLYNRWKKYRFKKTIKRIVLYIFMIVPILFVIQYKKLDISLPKTLFPIHQKSEQSLPKLNPVHSNLIKEKKAEDNKSTKKDCKQIVLPNKNFESRLHSIQFIQQNSFPNKKQKKPSQKHTITKKTKISIYIKEDHVPLQRLEQMYQLRPSASKALIIAKRYFNQKDYKKAAKWALKANNLNKNNEESWLLFAKSLAMQGKQAEAINILKVYYRKSHSHKALILLKDLEK